jgi:hypothetical protein
MKSRLFKIVPAVMLAVMASGLTACSGQGEVVHIAVSEIGDVTGDAVETGEVSALCPDGWTNVGADDIDAAEPGKAATNEFRFVKGGADQEALLTNAYINIVFHGPSSDFMQTDPNEWYDGVTDLEDFTTGEYTWSGYSAQSLGVPFVYVSAESDGCTIEAWLYTREGSENSASITDPDVLAILQSITF